MLSSPCPSCGSPTSITNAVCPSCGYDFEKTKPQQYQPPKQTVSNFPPATTPTYDSFHLMMNGQKSGPYALTQLRSMWNSGAITANSQYWCEGMATWQPILQMRHMLESAPMPYQTNYVAYQANYVGTPYHQAYVRPSKSRAAYIVLGLFFGCLGIHNFYAGRVGAGIAQLLITIFLGWLFIGIVITAFWALIEIIAVDTDGNGIRMS